ncbi:MAG: hypothetical protein AAB920_00815 [Patescibacteria group bacterium]
MAEVSIPTQQFVDIKEVRDGVAYLKSGGIRKILIVGGVNFDLKSEAEQVTILNSFQNFLNTIDFSIQLFIHSRKVNVDAYLAKMKQREEQEENALLKIQIAEYAEFIRSFVDQNAIINKTFFVIVPYEGSSIQKSSFNLLDMFKKQTKVEANQSEQAALEQLEHRVSEVTDGLEQVGLHVTQLDTDEIVELFYNMYNPQLTEKKGMELTKKL